MNLNYTFIYLKIIVCKSVNYKCAFNIKFQLIIIIGNIRLYYQNELLVLLHCYIFCCIVNIHRSILLIKMNSSLLTIYSFQIHKHLEFNFYNI